MVSLFKNKVNFRIKISEKEYLFNFEGSDKEKIKPCLIFQQKNNLNISKESFIGQKSNSTSFLEKIKECNEDSSKMMYFLIMKMMNVYGISKKIYNQFKQEYKNDGLENIFVENYFSLNNLFNLQNEENIPLIMKCWIIVYSLPKSIINYLLKYSLDLEKELLNSILKIYEKLEDKEINEYILFSKSMVNYLNKNSILWKIQTQYDNDIIEQLEYNIMMAENEKNELNKEIYKIDNSIWSIQNAENLLKSYILDCNEIKSHGILDKNKKEIKDKLQKLCEKLNSFSLENKEDIIFKNTLIENIKSLINDKEKLNNEYYQRYENVVYNFLNNMQEEKKIENFIKWPIYKLDNKNPNNFDKFDIYELLLWYSEIIDIFSKLIREDVSINDKINLSSKLLLIDEMKPVSKYLLDIILKYKGNVHNFKINQKNYKIIKSTLNAQFLSKLFIILEKKSKNLNEISKLFYNKIQDLDKLFNDLIKREEIKNEKEIEWAFEKIGKYSLNFKITLPEFEPKDIIFLFINYEKNSEDHIVPGPLLFNDNGNFQLIEISRIYYNKFKKFTKCFDEMINFFFSKFI